MRRFELLVNEVRESTDTQDINSVGVYEVMRYFNDAQKQIQKIIFTANPSADIFVTTANYDIAGSSAKEFDLPFDIYAHNSVISLHSFNGSSITRLANRERSTLYGYALVDKQFLLGFEPQEDLVLNYVYKLPVLSYRLGKISAIDTVTGIVTIDGASLIADEGFSDRYDDFSIVSSKGVQKATQLELTNFAGLDFTFTGTLTGVSVGDYIVCGESGTSHSLLSDECEPFLMAYVQRRILNKISSAEVATENIFSETERMDLEDLFKDNIKDALYPVSSDNDYLGY